jgi:hypothetical protein
LFVERSLTVLLPVRNAQSTLAASVTRILDSVADLHRRFELVIIDDGSTDATGEVVDELLRAYPQIRTLRHRQARGHDASVHAGMQAARGDDILIHDLAHPAQGPKMVGACRQRARLGGAAADTTSALTMTSTAPRKGQLVQPRHSAPARPTFLKRLTHFLVDE